MIPNIKISSKIVELVLHTSLCAFVSIEIERLRVVFQLTLEKKSRDNKTEALLAIHEVKIAYNEQSKEEFAVSFDDIFNEDVMA